MSAFPGAQILVVEDEHLVALDLEASLRQMGHTPVLAHSGEDAIHAIDQRPIDLVLMDIKLRNVIDGIDAANVIRRRHDVPLIYLTAYADDQTLARARETEPHGYLLKPFQQRELRATIEMTLQRRRSELQRLAAEQEKQFLADSVVRMTSTLDHKVVAREVGALLIPKLADWCVVATEPIADVDHDIRCVIEEVWRSGSAQVMHDIGTTLKAKTLVVLPLRARGETIGVLAAASLASRPPFGMHEIAFLEEFAIRLAAALDKALLYESLVHKVQLRDGAELPLYFSPWPTQTIVGDAVESLRGEASARGVKVAVDLASPTLEVACDRRRIVKVLASLITNAINFSPRGGVVTVRAKRVETGVSFEVCEATKQPSIEECVSLFERFWRLRADESTGMGLFVARGILEGHGSALGLEANIGTESRFYFILRTSA
jgi:CheY-like chemotaxis protein